MRAAPRRFRILHVVLNLQAGGLERMVADLLRGLDPLQFEPHLLALGFLGRFAEGLSGVCERHVAPRASPLSLIRPIRLARELARLGPDLVHTHSGVWYKAARAARMAGIRHLVHTDHGRRAPDPWMDRTLDGLASRRTECVVAVSSRLARQLRETVVAPDARIETIHNGIDTERFCPGPREAALLRELGAAPGPVIGSLGRFDYIKGYDVLLRAFAELRRTWSWAPGPTLILVGEGPEERGLRALAGDLGVADAVRFIPWRPDAEHLLRCFDVFALGSRSEGTSLSLLEAMSCGVHPVVTDVGGNAEVLGPELRHCLAPPGAAIPMGRLLSQALADEVLRRRTGALARERVATRFSLHGMIDRYQALYRELLHDA